jgi:hypothetical protein
MFARSGIRGWSILALVAVIGVLSVWIFYFRSPESPTVGPPSNVKSTNGIVPDAIGADAPNNSVREAPDPVVQNPFDPLGRLLNWEAFNAVDPTQRAEFKSARELQTKAASNETLTPAEVDRLIELSRFREDSLVQARALSALAELGEASPANRVKAVDAICEALKDPNWLVVSYAASGLAKLDARDKAPLLLPLLKHPEFRVRQKTQESLDRLGYVSGS